MPLTVSVQVKAATTKKWVVGGMDCRWQPTEGNKLPGHDNRLVEALKTIILRMTMTSQTRRVAKITSKLHMLNTMDTYRDMLLRIEADLVYLPEGAVPFGAFKSLEEAQDCSSHPAFERRARAVKQIDILLGLASDGLSPQTTPGSRALTMFSDMGACLLATVTDAISTLEAEFAIIERAVEVKDDEESVITLQEEDLAAAQIFQGMTEVSLSRSMAKTAGGGGGKKDPMQNFDPHSFRDAGEELQTWAAILVKMWKHTSNTKDTNDLLKLLGQCLSTLRDSIGTVPQRELVGGKYKESIGVLCDRFLKRQDVNFHVMRRDNEAEFACVCLAIRKQTVHRALEAVVEHLQHVLQGKTVTPAYMQSSSLGKLVADVEGVALEMSAARDGSAQARLEGQAQRSAMLLEIEALQAASWDPAADQNVRAALDELLYLTVEDRMAAEERFRVDRSTGNTTRTARVCTLTKVMSRMPNFDVIKMLHDQAQLASNFAAAQEMLSTPTIDSLRGMNMEERDKRIGNALHPLVEFRGYSAQDSTRIVTKMLQVTDADVEAQNLDLIGLLGSLVLLDNSIAAVLEDLSGHRQQDLPFSAPRSPPGVQLPQGFATALKPQQKQMIGERLYPLVARSHPDLAGKITGKLLFLDNDELLRLLGSPEQLQAKISEALKVSGALPAAGVVEDWRTTRTGALPAHEVDQAPLSIESSGNESDESDSADSSDAAEKMEDEIDEDRDGDGVPSPLKSYSENDTAGWVGYSEEDVGTFFSRLEPRDSCLPLAAWSTDQLQAKKLITDDAHSLIAEHCPRMSESDQWRTATAYATVICATNSEQHLAVLLPGGTYPAAVGRPYHRQDVSPAKPSRRLIHSMQRADEYFHEPSSDPAGGDHENMNRGTPDPQQSKATFETAGGTSLLTAFDGVDSTLEEKVTKAVLYVLQASEVAGDPMDMDSIASEYCKRLLTWERGQLASMLEDDADKTWPTKTLDAMRLLDNTRSVQAGRDTDGQAPESLFLPSSARLAARHERLVAATSGAGTRAQSPGAKTPATPRGDGELRLMIKDCLTTSSANLSLSGVRGDVNSPHSETVVKSWISLLRENEAEDILADLQSVFDKLDSKDMKYPTALRHILLAVGDSVVRGGDEDLMRQMIDVGQVMERWVDGTTEGGKPLMIKGAELLSPEGGDTNESFSSTRRDW